MATSLSRTLISNKILQNNACMRVHFSLFSRIVSAHVLSFVIRDHPMDIARPPVWQILNPLTNP
jgi:hypothetical protein